jgi:hypothetical protein
MNYCVTLGNLQSAEFLGIEIPISGKFFGELHWSETIAVGIPMEVLGQ